MFETKELGKIEGSVKAEVENCELDQVANDNQLENIKKEIMTVENNISGNPIEGGRLRCKICRKVSSSKSKLARHNLLHTEVKPFSCDLCENQYSRNDSLKRHIEKHKEGSVRKFPDEKSKIYSCDKCDYRGSRIKSLKEHFNRQHKKDTVPCDECEFTTYSERNIMRHKEMEHLGPGIPKKKRNNMKKHIESVHEGKLYKCNQCDFETVRRDLVTRHKKVAHASNSHFCNKCEGTFKSEFGLTQHIKNNHTGYSNSCDQCDYSGSSIKYLKEHIGRMHYEDSHSMERAYLCEKCSFIARSVIDLMRHVEDHNPYAFSCDQCEFKTKNNDILKRHINNVHIKGDVYECDECNYITTKYLHMVRHKEKQHLDVNYTCPDCDYVAKVRGYFLQHVRKHHKRILEKSYFASIAKPNTIKKKILVEDETSKIYSCDKCDYRGSRIKNVKEHFKRQHKKGTVLCDECEFTTYSEKKLLRHKVKEHQGPGIPIKKILFQALMKPVSQVKMTEEPVAPETIILDQPELFTFENEPNSKTSNGIIKNEPDASEEENDMENQKNSIIVPTMKIDESEIKTANDTGYSISCDQCDYSGSSIKYLKEHIGRMHHEDSHSMEKSYICDKCSFIAKSVIDLMRHVEDHNPHAFSCDQCEFKTKNNDLLKRHINNVHIKGDVYECDECNYTATKHLHMVRHKEKEHLDVKYTCPDCDYVSKVRGYFLKHVRKYHKKSPEKSYFSSIAKPNTIKKKVLDEDETNKIYSCDKCDYRGSRIKNLKEHFKRQHKNDTVPKEENYMEESNNSIIVPKMKSEESEINTADDENCGDTFEKENRLEQNMLGKHVNGGKVSCEVCRKVFPSKSKLACHNLVHTKEKSFACEICGNKYARIQSLKHHIETHQEGFIKTKKHNCTTCDKKFVCLSKLKRHEFTHTGERHGNDNFPCEVCGQLLSSRPRLLAHKMIHTGEKPYSCEQCGNGYRNNDNLNQHLKTHQEGFKNTKLHQCLACGKHFYKYSRLQEHEFTHSHPGVKPYQCLVCQVMFTYSESLKKHMKKEHDEKFV